MSTMSTTSAVEMDRHAAALKQISSSVAGFFRSRTPYRIHHGSTNSTRPRPPPKGVQFVDISALCNVVSVDTKTRRALVEPNVPMDKLVTATLKKGLVPPVVMEFPGITAGGGFAGTAGESSSFKHGFFDDTIESVEMVLGNGDIVKTSRTEKPDLFQGAAGSVGTLGVTTLIELNLIEAKRYVKATYHRTNSIAEAVAKVQAECENPQHDYIDGILFSKDHGVIITGEMTDTKPEDEPTQTFSGAWDPWFYLHVKENTASPGKTHTCYIPLSEYLFRYDRAGFWVGAAAYQYFNPVPNNRLTRWFLDDFMHTRMLYRALHGSGESARFIVQDLGVPYDKAEEFISFTNDEYNIWPLWLCPLKGVKGNTFHPVTNPGGPAAEGEPRGMLNIGLWGWGPTSLTEFIAKNRILEDKLVSLGGRKWLYAHTYYSEPEFWQVYQSKSWYDGLREKYHATTLPSVYDKVKVKSVHDPDKTAAADATVSREKGQIKGAGAGGWKDWVKRTRPLGGVYGMWKSIQSGDYYLHKNAEWKFKGEDTLGWKVDK